MAQEIPKKEAVLIGEFKGLQMYRLFEEVSKIQRREKYIDVRYSQWLENPKGDIFEMDRERYYRIKDTPSREAVEQVLDEDGATILVSAREAKEGFSGATDWYYYPTEKSGVGEVIDESVDNMLKSIPVDANAMYIITK